MMQAGAALVARNPIAVGGLTAFLVTFCFVSANALWYQPQGHPSALLPTRSLEYSVPAQPPKPVFREAARVETTEAQPAAPVQIVDPLVAEVQKILTELRLYDGPIDGIAGSRTRDAVKHYQRVVGLEQTGEMNEALLRHLGASSAAAEAVPVPAPRPEPDVTASIAPSVAGAADSVVKRIQVGLRAFGNHHIDIDGIAGAQTASAIREFQSLFGLPETGNPDPAVLKKMQDLGLAD